MQTGLLSYFDLGVSYGLSDTVFRDDVLANSAIDIFGLKPAIGFGAIATPPEPVLSLWTEEAARQVHRVMLDTGREHPRQVFDAELERIICASPIRQCTLTVYAVGIVALQLWFRSGVDRRFLKGLLTCFEFAGYKPAVAQALHEVAVQGVAEALRDPRSMDSSLTRLTGRDHPEVVGDAAEREPDGSPYQEQLLMSSFLRVLVCTEDADRAALAPTLQGLEELVGERRVVSFEYHGELHCGWATSAVVAKRVATPDDPGWDDPEDQVRHMLACIAITNVLYGTCEVFERLFFDEIDQQLGGYLRREAGGRPAEDLNRLRNLALAIARLTTFTPVTHTQGDQEYFGWFEDESKIQQKREFIREAAGLLFEVVEADNQDTRKRLDRITLLLAFIGSLTVLPSAYDFVRGDESLIATPTQRLAVFAVFLLLAGIAAGSVHRRRP